MRVRLLGTGSADGWPNAFCECASCRSAQQAGSFRVPTSVLVDGRLLLDCGPETPRAALRNEPAAQRLVATVGAFRGFGGEFLRPPKVCAADGVLFVTSAGATWRLTVSEDPDSPYAPHEERAHVL